MSISKKIVEHALSDNGENVRSSIYKSINEKVADLLESKKIELAGGALVSEDHCGDMDDLKDKMKKTKKKMKKLKEEIAILEEAFAYIISEESSCDDDDLDADEVADTIKDKKKKLKKSKKKMKKLKEAYALLESEEGEIDEDGEWSEEGDEESEESEDELSEGMVNRFVHGQLSRLVPKDMLTGTHQKMAKSIVDKHLGSDHPQSKDLIKKHNELAHNAGYNKLSDDEARHTIAKHLDSLQHEVQSIKKKGSVKESFGLNESYPKHSLHNLSHGFLKKAYHKDNDLYDHISYAIDGGAMAKKVSATKSDSEILRHHYDKHDTKGDDLGTGHTQAITHVGNKVHKIHGSKFE